MSSNNCSENLNSLFASQAQDTFENHQRQQGSYFLLLFFLILVVKLADEQSLK